MHWVIQKSIFKPGNYDALVGALDQLSIDHTTVEIERGTMTMRPDPDLEEPVYVCGAIKLANIARQKGWLPGSFLNDQFRFDVWLAKLGPELLNADIVAGTLGTIDTSHFSSFFIRPLEDNKAFDGAVIDNATLVQWRADPARHALLDVEVIASPVKTIYREYRLFVVEREIVTGSVYKVAQRPFASSEVEPYVIDYVASIIARWLPAPSCVVDVCLTDAGLKVIEFNNINSSGFYACDVIKYVAAVQAAYGQH